MKWTSELNVYGVFRRRQYVPIMCGGTIIAGAFVVDTDGHKITNYRDNARLIAAAPDLLEALETLTSAKALAMVDEIVAGWNGPPDAPYKPHPSHLRATIPTTCGAVYALDAAIKAARAAIAKVRGQP